MMPLNLVAVIALLAALVAGAGSWFVTDAIHGAKLAKVEKQHLERERDDAEASLMQFKQAAKVMNDAASRAQAGLSTLNTQLAKIRKENKDAPPLPADCHPDPIRMRSLTDSINAVNGAVAR